MAGGVPAGASMPLQSLRSKPLTGSATTGISGYSATRASPLNGDGRQQQVDQWVLELRQRTPPGRNTRGDTQFIGPVLHEPTRGFLCAEPVFDIHRQRRRHSAGLHDRRIADVTGLAGISGFHGCTGLRWARLGSAGGRWLHRVSPLTPAGGHRSMRSLRGSKASTATR